MHGLCKVEYCLTQNTKFQSKNVNHCKYPGHLKIFATTSIGFDYIYTRFVYYVPKKKKCCKDLLHIICRRLFSRRYIHYITTTNRIRKRHSNISTECIVIK